MSTRIEPTKTRSRPKLDPAVKPMTDERLEEIRLSAECEVENCSPHDLMEPLHHAEHVIELVAEIKRLKGIQ
jgi:hypothetical protein